jgi:hypothetical protein
MTEDPKLKITSEVTTTVAEDPELKAMREVTTALNAIKDKPEQLRNVLLYINTRFNGQQQLQQSPPRESHHSESPTGVKYSSIGDLFDAANPQSEAERVLVVGYWLQEFEKLEEFEAFPVNKHLKNLGHPVSNITRALESLMADAPRLVMQTSKSGTSKQARKNYKVTREGTKRVQAMIASKEGVQSDVT